MHNRRAQSLVEVTAGIAILLPVLLVLFDLSMLFLAVQANESICRNAARAAAAGDPLDATVRAQAVVNAANLSSGGALISHFWLVLPIAVVVTDRPTSQEDPLTGRESNPGGPVTGTVAVSTEVDVRPFVVYRLWGGKLPMKFRARHIFPISFTQPTL
ncbi:MAG: hypothetical protein KGS72_08425 [Cyanobacteria bacterium REEB67]|nr:hypothetical protein [Cyanobacteria bacterium REEB67]